MQREILFKAKRKDTGKWIEGYYVRLSNDKNKEISHRVYTGYSEKEGEELYEDWEEVMLETVSRYSELTDKNDVKIFENDILRDSDGTDWVVSYDRGMFIGSSDGISEDLWELTDLEVIGNVCDEE